MVTLEIDEFFSYCTHIHHVIFSASLTFKTLDYDLMFDPLIFTLLQFPV